MFSVRQYRALKDEEETSNNYHGKRSPSFCGCVVETTIVTCPHNHTPTSSAPLLDSPSTQSSTTPSPFLISSTTSTSCSTFSSNQSTNTPITTTTHTSLLPSSHHILHPSSSLHNTHTTSSSQSPSPHNQSQISSSSVVHDSPSTLISNLPPTHQFITHRTPPRTTHTQTQTSFTHSSSKSSSPISSSLTLQSIKAAWRSLTSLGFGSSRLPHLERSGSHSPDSHAQDNRYTQFPSSLTSGHHHIATPGSKRRKETSLHNFTSSHHLPLSGARSFSHPHRANSPSEIALKCLRKHRGGSQQDQSLSHRKSKSDNALHHLGVRIRSVSDQNLHKVCLIGGSTSNPLASNSIFSNVQLSGGNSGESGNSSGSGTSGSNAPRHYLPHPVRVSPQGRLPSRSRSLERSRDHRVNLNNSNWDPPVQEDLPRHTRSLERNYKLRIKKAHLAKDQPPDHPAPPPPTAFFKRDASLPTGVQNRCLNLPTPSQIYQPPTYTPQSSTYSYSSHSQSSGPDGFEGSGGSISLCSSSSSNSSTCGGVGGTHFQVGGLQNNNHLLPTRMEAPQSGSFINKPPRGWLHPDNQLAEEGICYGVRYIGALEVNTSMKSLNFDTRSLIAKECISKVCESAGLKTADRKRKTVKSIGRILGERPLMEHAGSNVTLTITSDCLTLTTLEQGEVVACHEMPNISFASGGDPDTLDFIAYVAKDNRYGRACFVLECGGGLAQDVITTIGQAFELRFKEYLKRTPTQNVNVQYSNIKADGKTVINGEPPPNFAAHDRDYYNDLPGKVPPELVPPPVPPLPQYSSKNAPQTASSGVNNTIVVNVTPGNALSKENGSSEVTKSSDNLIDLLSSDLSSSTSTTKINNITNAAQHSTNNLSGQTTTTTGSITTPQPYNPPPTVIRNNLSSTVGENIRNEPAYVNDAVVKQRSENKDPFDMQPFSMQLSQLGGGSSTNLPHGAGPVSAGVTTGPTKTLPLTQRLELQREPWFHGIISRKEAEGLMKQDGDFLVRESCGSMGQYVLSGMQNSTKKHLLLVDPEGVVRTKSRTFDSVSHLINYHRNNELPIVSAESALVLRNPVLRD